MDASERPVRLIAATGFLDAMGDVLDPGEARANRVSRHGGLTVDEFLTITERTLSELELVPRDGRPSS